MNNIKKTTKNLFQFLKEFNKLKQKPQLTMKSYEEVVWFHNIPKEKECCSIINDINQTGFEKGATFMAFSSYPKNLNREILNTIDIKSEKWIEIKKPKRKPCPEPPEEINPWLKNSNLNQHNIEPQILSYILKDSAQETPQNNAEETEEQHDRILLEDCPEIKTAFENYLNQKWHPWSQEEKRLEPVLKVYNTFYKIYNKSQSQGEVFQTVLGLGLLHTKNQKEQEIKRHIITAPLSINFNSVTGTLTVGPGTDTVELALEMDMFRSSEQPKNCDQINKQLSSLSNDFWIKEEFYNNLKSWLNSYDANGQFSKDFENPPRDSITLTICPAIILRKRNNKEFLKFYNFVLNNIDKKETLESPCIKALINTETTHAQDKTSSSTKGTLNKKYYFPLPANEEQKKIIKKVENNNIVVVQGPPGTGKTHSIANLICHFLANGQKVLVTSQTDRALRVLKNKLPEKIKPLCIEILGKDQKSFQDLKTSFETINTEYQNKSMNEFLENIKKMDQKDNDLKGRLTTVHNDLMQFKTNETILYQNLFKFYTGTPAVIALQVKEQEEQHKWIKESFNLNTTKVKCPISNKEALNFLILIRRLRNTEDSVLEESVEFLNPIWTEQQFKSVIQQEKSTKQSINQYKSLKNTEEVANYMNLQLDTLSQVLKLMDTLYPKVKSLLNREEKWVKKALNDCLANRDREWRYLHNETEKVLNDNENIWTEADKIENIKIDSSIKPSDFYLKNLLNDFFKKYNLNDKINWRFFCSNPVRSLKKIKINGKSISSYADAQIFQKYIKAKKILKKLNNFWGHHGIEKIIIKTGNFKRNYHIFKDFCEPLNECLLTHDLLEKINPILSQNNIPKPHWTAESVKKEQEKMSLAYSKNTLNQIISNLNKFIASLEPYKNHQNQIAYKIILAVQNKNSEEYKKALDELNNFKNQQEDFSKLNQVKEKLNNEFYLKLKKDIDNPVWENRLKHFEEAWSWQQADFWLKEQTKEQHEMWLNQERQNLNKKQKENMEQLVGQKAWFSCLSQITDQDLSSLKGWMQAINKIGKGTGISATKHRRVAKKRMEECKMAVPAWIMPLYRVVENIKPDTKPFDIAIIDEASQTGPDGFLIHYLAKKIIVVGDKEQISPENPGVKEDDVEIQKKKWLPDIKYSDHIGREYSYYDYCDILFTGSHIQLREHFRCMPEIIQFSNLISYSGQPLIPLRQYGSARLDPLKHVFVPHASSKVGSGYQPQNKSEAQAIVDQIKKCIDDPAYKDKTFGIISLQGQTQVKMIEQALLQIDKSDLEKRAVQVGKPYDFQGDERDVIFLSMAVAKDWPISALTRDTFKRQYNVATSRAKDQLWLFHSIEKEDLKNPEDFRKKLLDYFLMDQKKVLSNWKGKDLQELYKQIKETKNKSHDNAPKPFDSWFEARVFYQIASRGYQVIPQYEVAGFRIDMVIVGSGRKLAVECDGDHFHPESKKGADQERQWQLERCGWTFHRIRGSAFYRNEEETLKKLWDKLQ